MAASNRATVPVTLRIVPRVEDDRVLHVVEVGS